MYQKKQSTNLFRLKMRVSTEYVNVGSFNCEKTQNVLAPQELIEKYDILFLQELNESNIKVIKQLNLPTTLIFSEKTGIIIHHKINGLIKVHKQHVIDIGIQLAPDLSDALVTINNKKYHLINTYYPIADKSKQQKALTTCLSENLTKDKPIIWGGDFNHILSETLDRSYEGADKPGEAGSRKLSLELYHQLQLKDVFRSLFPTQKNHTNNNPHNNRRIDRFHISETIEVGEFHQEKLTTIKSTHDLIAITIKISNKPIIDMGRPRFIIRDNLMENPLFINDIIKNKPKNWKQLKQTISKLTRTKRYKKMEKELDSDIFDDLRVRFNGKTKPKNKAILKMEDLDGTIAETTDEILIIAKLFMETLYKKSPNIPNNITHYLKEFTTKVTNDERAKLDAPITLNELTDELTGKSASSTPGEDGFNFRFIKICWEVIGPILVNVSEEIQNSGKLPQELQNIIINLIPKKGKSNNINNTRPISIIDCAIRLISLVYNSRFQKILTNYISPDQHGFLSGRTISDASQKIQLVIDEMNKHKRKISGPGAILVDMAKAFDSLDHLYLKQVLKKFNLGPRTILFCMAITSGHKGQVLVNNKTSEEFKLDRGVRQGNPLSPLLFILALEPLFFQLNRRIQGIHMGKKLRVTRRHIL